eukprot:scaffold577475_cov18-Prasinocladus_malaysianus.AAC.1
MHKDNHLNEVCTAIMYMLSMRIYVHPFVLKHYQANLGGPQEVLALDATLRLSRLIKDKEMGWDGRVYNGRFYNRSVLLSSFIVPTRDLLQRCAAH